MKEKIITTIVLLLLLIVTANFGLSFFALIIGICAILLYLEFFNYRYKSKNINFLRIIGSLAILLIVFNGVFYQFLDFITYIIAFILAIMPMLIYRRRYSVGDAITIFGIIMLIGISNSIIIDIYKLSIIRCLYIFLVAFVCDIYSYIGTRLIGRHNIDNTNRTIEGYSFGIIMSTLITSVIHYNLIGENIVLVFIISFILSIASVIGDLIFYRVKKKLDEKKLSVKIIEQYDSVILVALLYMIIINII